jgi:hypothetical protein
MSTRLHGPSALCAATIRRLNFEMHLIQHGLISGMRSSPMLRVWLIVPLLACLWCVYWLLYPVFLALLIATLPISLVMAWRRDA